MGVMKCLIMENTFSFYEKQQIINMKKQNAKRQKEKNSQKNIETIAHN